MEGGMWRPVCELEIRAIALLRRKNLMSALVLVDYDLVGID